jgi:hypothetical protein
MRIKKNSKNHAFLNRNGEHIAIYLIHLNKNKYHFVTFCYPLYSIKLFVAFCYLLLAFGNFLYLFVTFCNFLLLS